MHTYIYIYIYIYICLLWLLLIFLHACSTCFVYALLLLVGLCFWCYMFGRVWVSVSCIPCICAVVLLEYLLCHTDFNSTPGWVVLVRTVSKNAPNGLRWVFTIWFVDRFSGNFKSESIQIRKTTRSMAILSNKTQRCCFSWKQIFEQP